MRPVLLMAVASTLLVAMSCRVGVEAVTNVACVGDSITYGSGSSGPTMTYPADLQRRLGSAYAVSNFGVPGTTMLRKGDFPYWNTSAFPEALASSPAIVVIQFGTNDAKSQNWPAYGSQFQTDYTAFIAAFAALASTPSILINIPPPLYRDGVYNMNATVINQQLPTIVWEIAFANRLDAPVNVFAATGRSRSALSQLVWGWMPPERRRLRRTR